MAAGLAYLVAIMEVYSRKILLHFVQDSVSWRLSNTADVRFCLDVLNEALDGYGTPEIFNTDQGSQFTSHAFTSILEAHSIRISMDSQGSWLDNLFIERFWRSIKYEEIYLHAYESVAEARVNIGRYIDYYHQDRRHSSLKRLTPNDAVLNEVKEAYGQSEPDRLIPPTPNSNPSAGWTGA